MHTSSKILIALGFAGVLVAATAFAASQSIPNLGDFSEKFTANATRACMFPAGGWTTIDCSNVAAVASAELNDWSRYVIQCTDDSYLAWGGAAVTADTSDGYVPNGAWLEFLTAADNRYVSCLNLNSDQDCRIVECR